MALEAVSSMMGRIGMDCKSGGKVRGGSSGSKWDRLQG